jgi:UDP-GlcNAc:undecaprenyl-phosphate/decaprenyl-phosphate GlcNAc-1-phosphate transferase
VETDAIAACIVAFAASAALTPLVARLARRVGAVDGMKERGLAREATPLLGGLAIFAGALIAALLFMPDNERTRGILVAAALVTAMGAVDDVRELPPGVKLAAQVIAALVLVNANVVVRNITIPFVGAIDFGDLGGPLTVLGLVAVMNVVNFSDGIDGLAAGVCAISAVAFAIIAFDLGRDAAGVLAAITAGAALGFLVFNFHPASVFMGDCGSNLLGLLLGAVIVEGSLKTNALVALVVPLVVLAVPFLDTGFVLAKRIKYRRPVYRGDSNHFHHRFHRIGFSQRRTVLYLYAWTVTMAGLAVALRFIPYSDDRGSLHPGWTAAIAACFVVALAASAYLVYVLEILKLRRLRAWQLRRTDPATSDDDIDEEVERELETGEFTALGR